MLNALKSLKRLKLLTFLIIFQLALGISLINNVVMQNTKNIDSKQIFNKIFNIENTYRIRLNSRALRDINSNEVKGENYKLTQIASGIKSLKDKGKVKDVYNYASLPCRFQKISGVGEKLYMDVASRPGESMNSYVNTIMVDENFLQRYPLEVDEGRSLNKEDFKIDHRKDYVPILLGSAYKEEFKIGDTFTNKCYDAVDMNSTFIPENIHDINFKIVGFIKDYSLITFSSKTTSFNAVRYSNGITVMPEVGNSFDYGKPVILSDLGLFIELNKNSSIDDLKNDLNEIILKFDPTKECGFDYSIQDMHDSLKNVDDSMKHDVNVTLILGVVLTLLSLVGITTTILGQLEQRKKEFGIKVSSGCNTKTLCKEIIYEILLMTTASIVISNIYMEFTMKEYKLSLIALIIDILLIFIFTLLISVLPVRNIRKYNPIELLKGGKK